MRFKGTVGEEAEILFLPRAGLAKGSSRTMESGYGDRKEENERVYVCE